MKNKSNLDEIESSMMDKENEEKRSPEELFAEIIKSSTEYTTESVESLLSNKTKILSILKTHRPIKTDDYHYGLSLTLKQNGRLIMFEWDDKRMVREYTQRSTCKSAWECLSCKFRSRYHLQPTSVYLYLVNDIVFLPNVHKCQPKDYDRVMQYQKYLEQGNVASARHMDQTVNFTFGQDRLLSVINVVSKPPNSIYAANGNNKIVAKTSASLKRKSNVDNEIGLKHPVNKKPKLQSHEKISELVKEENNQKVKNKLMVNVEPGHSSNQKDTVEVNKAETIPSNTLSFQIPSTSTLKGICNKLGIKYCKEEREFWKEIHIKEINASSTNIKTQKFKTKNLYKILSNFFTGKFCDYGQIYYAINSALCENLVSKGQMPCEEIDLLCSSYTVTDQHFKFIAKFLPCRILIFDRDTDGIRKFGKWKNSGSNVLTFIFSFSNRKYSVVVDL